MRKNNKSYKIRHQELQKQQKNFNKLFRNDIRHQSLLESNQNEAYAMYNCCHTSSKTVENDLLSRSRKFDLGLNVHQLHLAVMMEPKAFLNFNLLNNRSKILLPNPLES